MKRSEFKPNLFDNVKIKDSLLETGDQLVSDMQSLEAELDALGNLDEETRESIENAIKSAQSEVEKNFESDVEREIEELDKEFDELGKEAKVRADAASETLSNIKGISFEYMDPSILNDAASEAEASEAEWVENLDLVEEERNDAKEKIKSLKSALQGR